MTKSVSFVSKKMSNPRISLSTFDFQVIEAIKPQIKDTMITMVERVMNDAFKKLPADDLFNSLDKQQQQPGPVPVSGDSSVVPVVSNGGQRSFRGRRR